MNLAYQVNSISAAPSQSLEKQANFSLAPLNLARCHKHDLATFDLGVGAEVVVYRGISTSWESFLRDAPPGSVALDGFVADCSRSCAGYWNFDHHHKTVLRSQEKSTCLQVLDGLGNGFCDGLAKVGSGPTFYLNHICPDGIFAIHAILNRERLMSESSRLDRATMIYQLEDQVDRGSYQYDLKDPSLEILNWIVEPWWRDRARLELDSVISLGSTVEAVLFRLEQFGKGRAGHKPVEVAFQQLNEIDRYAPRPNGYIFLTKESPFTRPHLAQQGESGFVSLIASNGEYYWYRLGILDAKSHKLPSLEYLCQTLNRAEMLLGNDVSNGSNQSSGGNGVYNRWGSSQIVGGGPPRGSLIHPHALIDVINNFCLFMGNERLASDSTAKTALFIETVLPDLLEEIVGKTALGANI